MRHIVGILYPFVTAVLLLGLGISHHYYSCLFLTPKKILLFESTLYCDWVYIHWIYYVVECKTEDYCGLALVSSQQQTMASTVPTSTAEPSDEEMRKLLKPNPTLDHVLDALKASYIREGEGVKIVKELDSYDDRNYWIEINGRISFFVLCLLCWDSMSRNPAPLLRVNFCLHSFLFSGTSYLAKVHNGVESKDFLKVWKEESAHEKSVIHLQNTIMEHLTSHGIKTSVPVQPTTNQGDGAAPPTAAAIHSLPVVSKAHSPCDLVVRVLQWVPGRTMESFQRLPLEGLVDAGRFLGNFSNKLNLLDSNNLAASRRYHQWDGKNTADLKNFLPCIQDEAKRGMVQSVLDAFQRDLIDSGDSAKFRQALIHGDFNDANIIFDENFAVSGVLDFGDSVHR